MSRATRINLENTDEEVINPATEEKQDAAITQLEIIAGDTTSIDGKVSTKEKQDVIIDKTTLGFISSDNSTTTLLGIDEVFTGTAEDVTEYSSIFVQVFSDVASAIDGLSIEFSTDGTNWDETHKYTISAGSGLDTVHPAHAQFFRAVYTNGGTGQVVFRLQSSCKKATAPLISDRLGSTVDDEESAALVRSVISGKKPNGDYENVNATAGGNLKMSLEELESGISTNGNAQLKVNLFDSAGDEADIDSRSKSLGVILVDHKRIHNGESYFHNDFIDLASSASRQFILVTPNTTARIHFVHLIEFEKESSISITEGVSTSGDGTAISELNRDRNSGNTTTAVLTHTPTSPTGGTVIMNHRSGDKNKVGGVNRGEDELILLQNTKYLINITNEGATNSLTNWLFNWYEEIP